MNALRLDITYRPLRVGWAIKEGDFAALRKAVKLSYALWGGRFNPILVIDDLEVARDIATAFRVDLIHPIGEAPELKEFSKNFRHLIRPTLQENIISKDGSGRGSAYALDIHNALAYHSQKPGWEILEKEKRVSVFSWSNDDSLADMLLLQYGAYPDPEEVGIDYRKLFIRATSATEQHLDSKLPLPIELFSKQGIPWLTSLGIERHYTVQSFTTPGFFVGNASRFQDLVSFWNFRAADEPMQFIDESHLDRYENLLPAYEKYFREKVSARDEYDRYIAIRFSENMEEKARKLFTNKETSFSFSGKDYWKNRHRHAPVMYLGDASVLGFLNTEKGVPEITFPLNEKPFSNSAWFYEQNLVASIKFFIDSHSKQYTFRPLYIPELNEFYARMMHFDYSRIRIEPETIGIIIHASETDEKLKGLPVDSLVKKIFNDSGYQAELSHGGLNARQLVSHVEDLQGARSLKIPGVRRLIANHGPNDLFSYKTAIQFICQKDPENPSTSFKDHEDLCIESRSWDEKLKPQRVFSFLVEKGLFRQGVSVLCPSCNLKSWVSIDNMRQDLTCELCGHVHTVTRQLVNCDWQYRRSGILGLERNVMGAIPVVLTLQQLEANIPEMRDHLLYSMSLDLKSKSDDHETPFEIDFAIFIQGRFPEKIDVILGECKNRHSINSEDIANFKRLKAALPDDVFNVFLLVSKLSPFTPEEISLLKDISPHVILLGTNELEPYHMYEKAPKELHIRAWGGNLSDLVIATQKLYLKRDS